MGRASCGSVGRLVAAACILSNPAFAQDKKAVSKEEWQRSIRHASRLADCEARHFPGMFFGAKHWGLWVKHRAGSWKLIKLIEAAHGTRENVIRSHRGAALHQF